MHVPVRARLFLLRHPSIHWAAVACAVAVAVAGIAMQLRSIDDERRSWGETRSVLVAAADGAVGDVPVVARREVPVALTPDAAVSVGAELTPLRQEIRRGEILVDTDLATDRGPAALADDGEIVVAVSDPLVAVVEPGVAVTVYADGFVLADGARVVGSIDGVTLVAVLADDAAAVAASARLGTASLGFPG